MSGSDAQLFDDTFKIERINAEKYDRVARIYCKSLDASVDMALDINTELFPCAVGETLQIVIATSLYLDGSKDEEKGWRDATKAGGNNETMLSDMFEYVCHGKIYKFDDGSDGKTM